MIIANRHESCSDSVAVRCLLIAIICITAIRPIFGQAATAILSGIVIDESGASLADVKVTAASLVSGMQREVISAADGAFSIRMLPTGSYSVTAERQGFAPARLSVLVPNPNSEVTITIELTVANYNEAVSVQGAAARTENAAPSIIEVSPIEVRSVAGAGENIYHVLQTLPGVAAVNDFDSRLSVRGGGPDQNLRSRRFARHVSAEMAEQSLATVCRRDQSAQSEQRRKRGHRACLRPGFRSTAPDHDS